MDSGSLNPLLRMAVLAGAETAVRLHISRGDDLNARDGRGYTPLMLAAARKKGAIVALLLSAHADPTLLDSSGRDALAIAESVGATECAGLLRAAQSVRHSPSVPESIEVVPDHEFPLRLQPEHFSFQKSRPFNERVPEPTESVELTGQESSLDEEWDRTDLVDWEAEPEPVAPNGDEGLAEEVRSLTQVIGSHKAIDSDDTWDDIDAFLPDRAIPLLKVDGEHAGIHAVMLRAFREGSVPESLLAEACLDQDGSRNEDHERLLTFVLHDLGAETDEREESGDTPCAAEETFGEAQKVSEALAYADDLFSGRNDPLSYYQREMQKGELLDAEEEIALGREMEMAGAQALDALAQWREGIAAVLAAANLVACGEVDAEALSSGPEPSEDGESNYSVDNHAGEGEGEGDGLDLDNFAISFLAAAAEIRVAASQSPEMVRSALANANLSRGFLLALARDAGEESGKVFHAAITRQAEARERMIVSNLRLAYSIAMKYMQSGMSFADLVQHANIGLIKAVERFDWRKGFRFSTYATWWIRQQISRAIANEVQTVRLPVHMHQLVRRVLAESDGADARTGRPETVVQMAHRTGISLSKVRYALQLFEDTVPLEESDSVGVAPVDWLAGLSSQEPSAVAEAASVHSVLFGMVAQLPERDAAVITFRFGLGDEDPLTLEETGQRFGVTRERIRQVESKALERLRRMFSNLPDA